VYDEEFLRRVRTEMPSGANINFIEDSARDGSGIFS
jgi:hypothetical protein